MDKNSNALTSKSAGAGKNSSDTTSLSQEGIYEQKLAHPGPGAAGNPHPQEDDSCNKSNHTRFLNNPSNEEKTPLHPHSILTPLHRVGYVIFTSPSDSNLDQKAAHNHSHMNPHEEASSLEIPPVINFANPNLPNQVNNVSSVPIFTMSPGSEASSSNHKNDNTDTNTTDFLNCNYKAGIKVPVPQYQPVLFPSPIMIPQQWNSNSTAAHPPFSFSIPNSINGNANVALAPSPIPVAYLFSTLALSRVNNFTNKYQSRDSDTKESNSSSSEEEEEDDENVCDCVDCQSLKNKQNESDSHSDEYSSCSEYNYHTDTDESEEEKMMYDCQSVSQSHCCLQTLHQYKINSDREEEESQYFPDRTSKIFKNNNGRQKQRKRPLQKSDLDCDEATCSKRGKQAVPYTPTSGNADDSKRNNFLSETCQSRNQECCDQENCTSDLFGQIRSNLATVTHQKKSKRDIEDVDDSEADRMVHKNDKDEDEFEGESEKGDNNESDTEDDDEADADDEKDTEEDKNNCQGNCEKNINVVIVVKVKNASDPEQVFSNDDNGQENRQRISRQVSGISKAIANASSSPSLSKLTFSSQITNQSQNTLNLDHNNKVTILESSVAEKESHLNVSPPEQSKMSASGLSPQSQGEVVSEAVGGGCLVPTSASDDPLLQAIRHALGVQDDDEEDFEEEYEPIDEDEDNDNDDNENEDDEEEGETAGLFAFANTEDYRGRLALVENLVLSYGKISSLNEKLNVSIAGDVSHVVIGGFLVSASYITRESRKAGYSLGFYLDDLDQNSFLLQIQDGILRVGGRRDQTDLALRIEIGAPVRIEDVNVVHNKAINVIWVEVFF